MNDDAVSSLTRTREEISEDRKGRPRSHCHFEESSPILPRLSYNCSDRSTHLVDIAKAEPGWENGGIEYPIVRANNNQVVYEVLLVEMKLDKELEAQINN
ncbi:hypothetical protein CR513_30505, partial [Mucuna pruriens]